MLTLCQAFLTKQGALLHPRVALQHPCGILRTTRSRSSRTQSTARSVAWCLLSGLPETLTGGTASFLAWAKCELARHAVAPLRKVALDVSRQVTGAVAVRMRAQTSCLEICLLSRKVHGPRQPEFGFTASRFSLGQTRCPCRRKRNAHAGFSRSAPTHASLVCCDLCV